MRLSTDLKEALGVPRSPVATGEARVAELLDRVEQTADPARRIYILQEVARVCEHDVGDPGMAMITLRAALREDYLHDPVATQLARLANEHLAWKTLLPELMSEAKQLEPQDPRAAANLWVRIANWYADPLGRLDYATAAAKKAVETVPHHVAALATLSALLRQQGDWIGMVDVATRLAAVETDAETRVDLYLSIAGVAATHLQDEERAVLANQAALSVAPGCVAALQNLETIYRQRGSTRDVLAVLSQRVDRGPGGDTRLSLQLEIAKIWERELDNRAEALKVYQRIDASQTTRAIEMMKQLATDGSDPTYQAVLYDQIGRFRINRRGDEAAAEWCYIQALSFDDTYLPSMHTLVELYSKRGDWKKAASMNDRARRYTADPREKLALALESARIYLNELNDTDHAAARYADIIAADPDHLEAATALAELYYSNECWPELAPILARLRRLGDAGQTTMEEQRLYYLSARCASGLGNQEQAYDWYDRAHAMDPADPEVLRGLADEQFARQNWRRAIKLYHDLLEHSNDLDQASERRIRVALGTAHMEASNYEHALTSFRQVLAGESSHRDALLGVIRCCTALSDWNGVAKATRALIGITEGEPKLELLRILGDLHRNKRNDLPAALAAYRAAIGVCRSDHAALQRVLDVAAELKQWDVAAATIERFAELEPEPIRTGQYLLAAAEVFRDKIQDDDRALEYYDRALDSFFSDAKKLTADNLPRFMKSFADADEIYTRKRAWKDQERAYRHMIRRLPAGHELLSHLWHGLGEIYRSRLRQPGNAIAAFEVARDLDPKNVERREILAELYVSAGPDQADKAIAEHQAMLDLYPTKYDSYIRLGRTFMSLGRYDEAWCVCRALVFMGQATPEATRFFDRYNQAELTRATRRLAPDRWKHIYHPQEDRLVSSIMSMVWSEVSSLRARSPRGLGLRKKDMPTPRQWKAPRVQLFSYAAQALGLRTPQLYVQHTKDGGIVYANCQTKAGVTPSLVLRSRYFNIPDHRSAAFVLGKKLCYLRPEHVLSLAYGSVTELQAIFDWAVRRRANNWSAHADGALIDELSRSVTPAIGPSRWEQLQQLAARERRSEKPRNLSSWRVAIDHTADRTGFILCNDLQVAASQIASEHSWPGMPQADTRITDLLRYSVSNDYFAVRRHLGMGVGVGVGAG